MKVIIFLVSIILLTKLSTTAQVNGGKWRIIAGIGTPIIGVSDKADETTVFIIGLKKNVNHKINLGFVCNYSSDQKSEMGIDGNKNSYFVNYDLNYYSLLGNLEYIWKNNDIYYFYSGVNIGFTTVKFSKSLEIGNTSNSKYTPPQNGLAYHITAIGFHSRVGYNGLGLYAELGYGCNRILNLGLSYTF